MHFSLAPTRDAGAASTCRKEVKTSPIGHASGGNGTGICNLMTERQVCANSENTPQRRLRTEVVANRRDRDLTSRGKAGNPV